MMVKINRKIPAIMAVTLMIFLPSGNSVAVQGEATVLGQVRFETGPARESIVYLLSRDPGHSSPAPMVMTLRQKGLNFEPRFGIVTPVSTIRFENNDDEMHNIKSNSPGNRFDTGVHMPGTIKEVVLKRAGPVRLRCSIHSEMRAFLFVSPSTYYGVVDSRGRFSIDQVPYGTYRAEVWNQRMTLQEIRDSGRSILVGEEPIRLNFDLKPSAPEGSDLADVVNRDWRPVQIEIRKALDQAMARWKNGGKTAAMLKVMTTHSRLFNESGLYDAIAQRLGKTEAAVHNRRFNALMKALNKDRPSPLDEGRWMLLTKALLDGLDQDIRALGPHRSGFTTVVPKENRR